jgi:hypothetical protein
MKIQNIKTISFCLFTLCFLSYQCKKQALPPTTINFNGITKTDFNAQPLGAVDPTDWTLNDNWTAQEIALFSGGRTVCTSVLSDEKIFSAAPNPAAGGEFNVGVQAKENVGFMFRIIDKNFNVLLKNDTLTFKTGYNTLTFNLPSANITIKDTVRIYYKMVRGTCEMRGHGDVLIK